MYRLTLMSRVDPFGMPQPEGSLGINMHGRPASVSSAEWIHEGSSQATGSPLQAMSFSRRLQQRVKIVEAESARQAGLWRLRSRHLQVKPNPKP